MRTRSGRHTSLSGTSHTLVRAVKHVAHTWREGRFQGSAAQPVRPGFPDAAPDDAAPVQELAQEIAEEAGGVGFQNSVYLLLLKMDSSNTIRKEEQPVILTPAMARHLRAVIQSVLSVVSHEMVETRVLHSLAPIGATMENFADRQAFEAAVIDEELRVAREHEGSMRRAMLNYVRECASLG